MPFSSCFLLPGVKKDIKEEAVKKGSPYPAPALGDWLIETGSLVTSYGLWFGFCFRRLQAFPNDIFYVLPHVFEVVLDVKV